MATTYSIGEASASTGLSPDALRYYEHNGIIGPFARDMSNRRRFTLNDIAWIGVVTCMRDAGLRMADLRTFATILQDGGTAADPTIFLRERRAALAARAATLARAIGVLDDKIAHFAGHSELSHGSSLVHVRGELRCHDADQAKIVSTHLDQHAKLTRAEPGCITFVVVPTDDPLVWSVEECFSDRDALAAHQSRVAASEWGRLTKDLGHDYTITDE